MNNSAEFYEELALAEVKSIGIHAVERAQVYATLALAAAQPQPRWLEEKREHVEGNLAMKAMPGEPWCGAEGPEEYFGYHVYCNRKPHQPDGEGRVHHMAIDDDGSVKGVWQ